MKYIRTGNDVYEVEAETEKFYYTNMAKQIGVIKSDKIREADTIDELCDEFVGLVKSTSSDFIIMRVIAHSLKELKESLKTKLNGEVYEGHYDIIYGAIWTEWGLKYVAKLNEKGELVLI